LVNYSLILTLTSDEFSFSSTRNRCCIHLCVPCYSCQLNTESKLSHRPCLYLYLKFLLSTNPVPTSNCCKFLIECSKTKQKSLFGVTESEFIQFHVACTICSDAYERSTLKALICKKHERFEESDWLYDSKKTSLTLIVLFFNKTMAFDLIGRIYIGTTSHSTFQQNYICFSIPTGFHPLKSYDLLTYWYKPTNTTPDSCNGVGIWIMGYSDKITIEQK